MKKRAGVVVWLALLFAAAIPASLYCGPECVNVAASNYHAEPIIGAHHIHAASATILALTVFGSVLSVRIAAVPDRVQVQTRAIAAIFAGVIAITAIHVTIMISTCCTIWAFTQSAYACGLVLTMLFMFLLLAGFGALIGAQLKEARQTDKRRRSARDDQDEYTSGAWARRPRLCGRDTWRGRSPTGVGPS